MLRGNGFREIIARRATTDKACKVKLTARVGVCSSNTALCRITFDTVLSLYLEGLFSRLYARFLPYHAEIGYAG